MLAFWKNVHCFKLATSQCYEFSLLIFFISLSGYYTHTHTHIPLVRRRSRRVKSKNAQTERDIFPAMYTIVKTSNECRDFYAHSEIGPLKTLQAIRTVREKKPPFSIGLNGAEFGRDFGGKAEQRFVVNFEIDSFSLMQVHNTSSTDILRHVMLSILPPPLAVIPRFVENADRKRRVFINSPGARPASSSSGIYLGSTTVRQRDLRSPESRVITDSGLSSFFTQYNPSFTALPRTALSARRRFECKRRQCVF